MKLQISQESSFKKNRIAMMTITGFQLVLSAAEQLQQNIGNYAEYQTLGDAVAYNLIRIVMNAGKPSV